MIVFPPLILPVLGETVITVVSTDIALGVLVSTKPYVFISIIGLLSPASTIGVLSLFNGKSHVTALFVPALMLLQSDAPYLIFALLFVI